MMFRRTVVAAVFVLAGAPAWAGAADDAEAVRAVIQSQLEAFEAGDLGAAFKHAAPVIKRKFVSPQVFGDMVENGYPMIWAPARTEFLDAEQAGEAIIQRLRVEDAAGRSHVAEYKLVRLDGVWRIAAVRILPDQTAGV